MLGTSFHINLIAKSGSGPSIFALSEGEETAKKVGEAMANIYKNTAINFDIHISKINAEGIKII